MYIGYLPPLAEESTVGREARKKAAATNSAEAEASATIAADYDAAIADEAIDKSALEAMAHVEAEHGTKEWARQRRMQKPRRKRNWRTPKSCCC
jgi:hypothetical protein